MAINDYFKGMDIDGDEEGGAYHPAKYVFDGTILQLVKCRIGSGDEDFETDVVVVARCDREDDADILIAKLNEANRIPEMLFNLSAKYEMELEKLRAAIAKATPEEGRKG